MACSSSSVFTSGLLAFPYVCCLLAGPLRHVHASRVPGLLRGLRPIPCLQRTVRLSRPRGWSPRGGTSTRWFPCSLRIDRPGRHPALPRQHRHGYAAGLHRDLPAGTPSQLRSQPPPGRGGRALHPGPYPPDLSRCHAYGALPPVPVRMPSGLARRTPPRSCRCGRSGRASARWQLMLVLALAAAAVRPPGGSENDAGKTTPRKIALLTPCTPRCRADLFDPRVEQIHGSPPIWDISSTGRKSTDTAGQLVSWPDTDVPVDRHGSDAAGGRDLGHSIGATQPSPGQPSRQDSRARADKPARQPLRPPVTGFGRTPVGSLAWGAVLPGVEDDV